MMVSSDVDAHNPQSITPRASLNEIASISIFEVRHDNKGPIIPLVCTKEFYDVKITLTKDQA